MKQGFKIREILAYLLVAVGLALLGMAVGRSDRPGDTEAAARRTSRILDSKVKQLDVFMQMALEDDFDTWMNLGDMPNDMVIYHYRNDSLKAWCNEFPIGNDNIALGVMVPFMADPRFPVLSPLVKVTETLSYLSLGSKWYLAKSLGDDRNRVIGGLEIRGAEVFHGSANVNKSLKLGAEFCVEPLSSGGTPVYVGGSPMFEIICESMTTSGHPDSMWIYLAVVMFMGAVMLFLSNERSLSRLWISALSIVLISLIVFFWGKSGRSQMSFFSPMLYSGGSILYSLGAVFTIHIAIVLLCVSIFMCRRSIAEALTTKTSRIIGLVVSVLAILLLFLYAHTTLSSIVFNSGVSLDMKQMTPLSIAVYASFIALLICAPLLAQSQEYNVLHLLGRRLDCFSLTPRAVYACLVGAYLVLVSSALGIEKEENRMSVIANRLAFDRDISLELRLRGLEQQIADDPLISALSVLDNTESTIRNRIAETYFGRGEQNYSVAAYVFNDGNATKETAERFNSLVRDGSPISDGSRFLYVKGGSGRPYYVGVFMYVVSENVTHVLVTLESHRSRAVRRGFPGMGGMRGPDRVMIPDGYSYARYEGVDVKSYEGNYAYPTKMDEELRSFVYDAHGTRMQMGGYTHFVTQTDDNQAIILSRERNGALSYVVMAITIALIAFLLLCIFVIGRERKRVFTKNYYRTRISAVLLISLTSTLLALAIVSVLFVYSRNEADMRTSMSDKISSISSMIEAGISSSRSSSEIDMDELRRLIERVGANTNSEISLYSPSGVLMLSTGMRGFERFSNGSRMSGEAYGKIVYENRRYCMQKERIGFMRTNTMYSTILGSDGNMLAIASVPYNDESRDFKIDAVIHSMTIISLFILLLLIAMLAVSRIVDKMFSPLAEMSDKMTSADLEALEYIEYKRNDEISSIVQAYNRMVTELSESSRKLAQAERDKAWSGMARQVAHEIKNPLTPMKLQLQRIIRLKDKGDPAWQTRFDEAAKVLLDHIDILTDTANEFSTFAKLYTEEHTQIKLDDLLREEIAMFDNKPNIKFDYLGLDNVVVSGPKPQLTRVFVNLINNAVQAIGEAEDGHIVVALRNSVQDGCYDIVVEDNGPGVAPENVDKLFTPNFTTKNGGSGLGLAISRSILEKCGAKISYSRSFTLGGACFSIVYPK